MTIGENVVNISSSAFSGCDKLETVHFNAKKCTSPTQFASSPFYGKSSIKEMTFGDKVTIVPDYIAYGCTGIEKIQIPDSVTSIGISAFQGCSGLTSVNIPDSVTNIGYSAFKGCSGLMSVNIPNNVTSIGNSTFEGCSNIAFVTIGENVTNIGSTAFSDCDKLETVYFNATNCNSPMPSGFSPFCSKNSIKEFIFGENVTIIPSYLAAECKGLTNIIIPNSVTKIGDAAFNGCSNIARLTIGENVTDIGTNAFDGCDNLEIVYFNAKDCISSSVFSDNPIKEIILGEKVTQIPANFVSGCKNLTTLTIPNSVTIIGANAFSGCSNLDNVNIPNGVTSIEQFTFNSCSSLSSIIIPSSVTNIGSSAFYGCSTLTSVNIPDSIVSIGSSAFQECTNLTKLTIGENVTSIEKDAFSSCNNLECIYFNAKNCAFTSTSHSTPLSPFAEKSSIEQIIFGENVNQIPAYIAYGCINLTYINIPNNVTKIGNSAFYGCSNLTELVIGEKVKLIEDNALSNCNNLKTIRFNAKDYSSISSYSDSPFYKLNSINEIILGENVIQIPAYFAYGCDGLLSIVIPNSVIKIGEAAFYGCCNLASVTIPDNITNIEKSTFYGCSNLTSINIPNKVVNIADNAFYNCSSISELTIGEGIDNISSNAFTNCDINIMYFNAKNCSQCSFDLCSIKECIFGNNVEIIPERIFVNSQVQSITIGKNVKSIGIAAFANNIKTFKTLSTTPPELGDYNISNYIAEIEVPANYAAIYAKANKWKDIQQIYSVKDGIKCYPAVVNLDGDAFLSVNGNIGIIDMPEGSTAVISANNTSFSGHIIYQAINISDKIRNGDFAIVINKFHKNNIHTYLYDSKHSFDITLDNSGELIDKIVIENLPNVYRLKIKGEINGTDILTIRKMTNLRVLDLQEATIVEGGMSYYEEFITSKNKIGDYFFKDKSELMEIYLPDNVETIGASAFEGCKKLQSIRIPSSVKDISTKAFSQCDSLSVLRIEYNKNKDIARKLIDAIEDLSLKTLYTNCNLTYRRYQNDKSKYLPSTIMSIFFLDSITHIDDSYKYCKIEEVHTSNLTNWCKCYFEYEPTSISHNLYLNNRLITDLIIPNDVTNISDGAFSGCESLTSVIISDNVKSFASSTFADCKNVVTLVIGNGITNIPENSFQGCEALTSITIGKNVAQIGDYVFSDGTNITEVNSLNTIPPVISENTFSGVTYNNATLYVPKGCRNIYWLHPYWEDFFEIKDFSTGIANPTTDNNDQTFELVEGKIRFNKEGESVYIYKVDGTIVHKGASQYGQTVEVPTKGIYIIKVGNCSKKIAL